MVPRDECCVLVHQSNRLIEVFALWEISTILSILSTRNLRCVEFDYLAVTRISIRKKKFSILKRCVN